MPQPLWIGNRAKISRFCPLNLDNFVYLRNCPEQGLD
jgi:hypothetical protein